MLVGMVPFVVFYSISDVRLLLICDDWSRTESSRRRAVLRDGGGSMW